MIAATRQIVQSVIPSLDKEELQPQKRELQQQFRSRAPDAVLPWFDAAVSLNSEGNQLLNPLLGTGGNEGRSEFSRVFMQQVVLFLIEGYQHASSLLE